MKELTEYKHIDKSGWGEGPWQNEPDAVEWQDKATGYHCLIKRHPTLGHLCGYVGVPQEHPAHEKRYDDLSNIEVHGGLTFAGPRIRLTGDGSLWWFGFDCAHAGDYTPGLGRLTRSLSYRDDIYRDFHFVIEETERLARQLKEME